MMDDEGVVVPVSKREYERLCKIEKRAREAVAGYLQTDTSVGSISELHPYLDNLRVACGMSALPDDR